MSARGDLTMLILGKTAPRAADAILAAGYRKPRTLGYIILSKRTNRMDWDDEIYVTTEAAIDSLCGPYQDYTRDPADEMYWGKDYHLCPVIEPEADALKGTDA